MLDKNQEFKLVKQAKNGDIEAYAVLVKDALRLVTAVVKKYEKDGDWSKLVLAGFYGWQLAFKKFDSIEYKFSTYAVWWIRAAIIERLTGESIPDQVKKRPTE